MFTLTRTDRSPDVEPVQSGSSTWLAVMACGPTPSGGSPAEGSVRVKTPFAPAVAVPSTVAPSRKVTGPGADGGETVAVSVTASP